MCSDEKNAPSASEKIKDGLYSLLTAQLWLCSCPQGGSLKVLRWSREKKEEDWFEEMCSYSKLQHSLLV